jgi:hypothetical protein
VISTFPTKQGSLNMTILNWRLNPRISVKFICFIGMFFILIARNPVWNMLWDADGYMNSAIIWVTGGPHESVADQLYGRGFLTSIVYFIPAFLGINFFEPTQFGTYIYVFVMVQNAIIISWMSSYALPKIVGLFQPINNLTVFMTSLLGFYVMSSFVPYSLMDIWALACLMPVVYLIHSEKKIALSVSGLLLGLCLNLRPSYLFAILLLIGSAFVIKKLSVFLMLPGLIVSQIPQIIYNDRWNDSLSIFPIGLGKVTGQLATFAAYSIRYDTVAYRPFSEGGLSFCDKNMMEIALIAKPESTFETALLFLQNPGQSAIFLIKKLAAAFWWPVTVPYYEHNPLVNSIYGALVLLIVVFGLSRMILMFVSSDQKKRFIGVIAVLIGFLINLVLYSNETRYGLSVVLIAICGIAICVSQFNLSTEIIGLSGILNKANVATLAVYIFLSGIAVFTLMGNFGFETIKNCG